MTERVHIPFQFDGKQLMGTLEAVCGAGAQVYHLMVNRYYWGRLRLNPFREWVLTGKRKVSLIWLPNSATGLVILSL
jgi:hypothetical protein